MEVVLGGKEQQVSDEDEGGTQDEGEEELDVDQVSSAVKSSLGERGHITTHDNTGYTDILTNKHNIQTYICYV